MIMKRIDNGDNNGSVSRLVFPDHGATFHRVSQLRLNAKERYTPKSGQPRQTLTKTTDRDPQPVNATTR